MSAESLGCQKRPLCTRCADAFREKPKAEKNLKENKEKTKLDTNFCKILEKWSNEQSSVENDNEKSVHLLKAQLERYETELALRQLRQQCKSNELQRKLAPISLNWSLAFKRMKAIQQGTHKAKSSSVDGNMQPLRLIKQNGVTTYKSTDTSDHSIADDKKVSSDVIETKRDAKQQQPTATMPVPSDNARIKPNTVITPPLSYDTQSTDSLTSFDEMEKGCHLTDLLMEMMRDTEKSTTARKERTSELSNGKLASVSRNDIKAFEHIILENTKQSLLLSQPTKEELNNWETGNLREIVWPEVKFSKKTVEIRIFCPLCTPRHWNKPSCITNE